MATKISQDASNNLAKYVGRIDKQLESLRGIRQEMYQRKIVHPNLDKTIAELEKINEDLFECAKERNILV